MIGVYLPRHYATPRAHARGFHMIVYAVLIVILRLQRSQNMPKRIQ